MICSIVLPMPIFPKVAASKHTDPAVVKKKVVECDKALDTLVVKKGRSRHESARERIPRGLPRGKRAKRTGCFVPLKDRRFSAACCGELQFDLKFTFDFSG
jgi:hypothetical protein